MPTAFISYSWESDAHRQWVHRFASDLRAAGVTVLLDQWAVRLGDDVTLFMERSVSTADFVVLVCTEAFATKANNRHSGVGYEQAIVTSALLNGQPVRGRFVCVLRSGTPSSSIPLYLQTRLWLDVRDEHKYREGVAQLLIHLLDRYESGSLPELPTVRTSASLSSAPASAPPPDEWVLVAGSGTARAFTSELAALSEYLGSRLAERGCGLVTGGWFGVDETTARAFASAAESGGIALEDRLVQVLPRSKQPAFAAGQLVFVNSGEPEWTEAIERSTSVILLGGVGGTWTTGEIALRMGKLVLPLADTGGDAKKLYLHVLENWAQPPALPIDQRAFQRVARPGRSGVDAALEIVTARRSAV